MPEHQVESAIQSAEEQTLGVVLQGMVLREVPERFFVLIQLAIPWAIQFERIGLWRPAAGMGALSAIGLWGLCAHRLLSGEITGWKAWALRVGRLCAGIAAVGLGALVVVNLMARVLPNWCCSG